MNHRKVIFLIVVASLVLAAPAWRPQQDPRDISAVVIKVVKDVKKRGGTTTSWQNAIPLDRLRSGYEVRTDAGSAALIKFADDSKIVVRQNSIVSIKGRVQGRQILDRDVHMQRGNVGFNVKRQANEQFRFTSPISVASIRGTKGSFNVQDTVVGNTCTEGLYDVTNTVSNTTLPVTPGITVLAFSNGNNESRPANQNEIDGADADNTTPTGGSQQESDPGQGEPGDTGGVTGQYREVIISGEDNNGQTKRVIIRLRP